MAILNGNTFPWLLLASFVFSTLIMAALAWRMSRSLGVKSKLAIRIIAPFLTACLFPVAWIPAGYLAGVSFARLQQTGHSMSPGFYLFLVASVLVTVLAAGVVIRAIVLIAGRFPRHAVPAA